jgi:hypothetical protein
MTAPVRVNNPLVVNVELAERSYPIVIGRAKNCRDAASLQGSHRN